MPKKVDPLETLVEELKTEEVIEEPVSKKKVTSEDVERKRAELLKLAESGEISKTPAAIAKAFAKVIEKIYLDWENDRMEKANRFLCDQLIRKFSAVLGGLDAIEKPVEMEKELRNDPLLRQDVERVVSIITPWIPFLGILSGGITVGKHVLDHTGRKVVDGFARGPFGGEGHTSERTEEEVKNDLI